MSCCQSYGRTPVSENRPGPQRLLILGGTSFLGIHMTELALQRGHTVTLFNRGRTRSDLFPGVERLKGDRDGELDALRGRAWDAVIDNCGYVPRHVRLSASLLAPNIDHYLFVSTISVYADFSRVNDESSPLTALKDETGEDPKQEYGALKALCESTAEAALPRRTTIVRPGLIVGPEDPTDRFTYWPARAARGGDMLAPGDPQASFQLIDARDLARFCLDAIEKRLFGVYNATSPAGLFTVGDIVRESVAAGSTLAHPNPRAEPIWVSARFLAEHGVRPFADLPGWVPDGSDLGRIHHARVDKALRAGLKIAPLSETTHDTLAWHLDRWRGQATALRAGITPERERELLALWRSKAG
jgi:2'-hydroxyisoflavone reductase